MRRLWALVWKEVRLAFRDVGAIVTMLVTPLVLTLVIGAAFGGGDTPLSDVPVLLLDKDQSIFSEQLIGFFQVEDVAALISLEIVSDEAPARARVEADEVAALVIIPAGFSSRMFPLADLVRQRLGLDLLSMQPDDVLTSEQEQSIGQAFLELRNATEVEPAVVEIYASSDWRLSAGIVKSVIRQGIEVLNIQVQGIAAVGSRLYNEQADLGDAPTGRTDLLGMDANLGSGGGTAQALPIELQTVSSSGRSFDWLSYSAASMSVLFLMFAVTSGGRSLLFERAIGTLPRLLVAPLPAFSVLLGKMGGVVVTGLLQMTVLWGATSLIGA